MTSRERIKTIMDFGIPDRVGMHDWFWRATPERWRREGLPEGANLTERFGFDIAQLSCDQSLRVETEVLEEDGETYVERNGFGMTQRKWKGIKQGASHQIDLAIKTPADWEKHKQRLLPAADRFPADIVQRINNLHDRGFYVTYFYLEPFELAWRFLGFTETLMLMAAAPEFISRIFEACADQIIGTHEAVAGAGYGDVSAHSRAEAIITDGTYTANHSAGMTWTWTWTRN